MMLQVGMSTLSGITNFNPASTVSRKCLRLSKLCLKCQIIKIQTGVSVRISYYVLPNFYEIKLSVRVSKTRCRKFMISLIFTSSHDFHWGTVFSYAWILFSYNFLSNVLDTFQLYIFYFWYRSLTFSINYS